MPSGVPKDICHRAEENKGKCLMLPCSHQAPAERTSLPGEAQSHGQTGTGSQYLMLELEGTHLGRHPLTPALGQHSRPASSSHS